MLIASVLVAALMSVVWGMMSMYNGYLTAGQTQAVEQQLTRSLLQWLEDDLQSVAMLDTNAKIIPVDPLSGDVFSGTGEFSSVDSIPPAEDASAFNTADQTSDANIAEPSIDIPGMTNAPGRLSLNGNSTSIRLSIERVSSPSHSILPMSSMPMSSMPASDPFGEPGEPNSMLAMPTATSTNPLTDQSATTEGVAPQVPEFQTIIWQFQAPGVMSGTQSEDTESSVDRTTLETLLFSPTGAATDSATTANADTTAVPSMVPKIDAIPEVVGFRLEYFSGSSWASSWNSQQQQGLPIAVRIRLRLITPQNLAKLNQSLGLTSTQDSPLDSAIQGASPNPSSTGTGTDGMSGANSATDPMTDPFESIPTRQIERIILLQPISGPMPSAGDAPQSEPTTPAENPGPQVRKANSRPSPSALQHRSDA
jgi:hypothetical protein